MLEKRFFDFSTIFLNFSGKKKSLSFFPRRGTKKRIRKVPNPWSSFVKLLHLLLVAPLVDVDFKGQTYRGMASVGKNVTFDGKELRFEVNLFDFSGDIYGHTLTIHWLDKIREMVKFDGIDQLVAQLEEDEAVSRNWTED